jgi:hypothetical protein
MPAPSVVRLIAVVLKGTQVVSSRKYRFHSGQEDLWSVQYDGLKASNGLSDSTACQVEQEGDEAEHLVVKQVYEAVASSLKVRQL